MLSPDSVLRASWDLSLFAALIYQSFTLPMRIAFELPTTDFTFHLEMTIDIMFMIDIFLNFNTGIYVKGMKIM